MTIKGLQEKLSDALRKAKASDSALEADRESALEAKVCEPFLLFLFHGEGCGDVMWGGLWLGVGFYTIGLR